MSDRKTVASSQFCDAIVAAARGREEFSVRFKPVFTTWAAPLRAIFRHPVPGGAQRQYFPQWTCDPGHISGCTRGRHGSRDARERRRRAFYTALLPVFGNGRTTGRQIRKVDAHASHQIAGNRVNVDCCGGVLHTEFYAAVAGAVHDRVSISLIRPRQIRLLATAACGGRTHRRQRTRRVRHLCRDHSRIDRRRPVGRWQSG